MADNVVNACAMVRSDRATSLEEVFALHPALAKRRQSWQAIMEPVPQRRCSIFRLSRSGTR